MDITDPYMLRPTLTADGRPWTQRCFVCGKTVDLLKSFPHQRIRVDGLVRHARCRPEAAR